MEIAILAAQQAQTQTNAALAMIRNNAKAEQAAVTGLAEQALQAGASGGRGTMLDISV